VFYDKYVALCAQKGITPSAAAKEIGINKAAVSNWKYRKNGPSDVTLQKIADYFGVPVSELTGEKEKAPGLTEKDRRDVAKLVENIMSDMEQAGDLNFDGMPMSEEARAAMASAMRIGLEEARRRNKETYTPKKYRKG